MMTAVSASSGKTNARRNSVVLPLPRKPVSKVVGRVSGSSTLFTIRPPAILPQIVSRGDRGGKLSGPLIPLRFPSGSLAVTVRAPSAALFWTVMLVMFTVLLI